MISLELVVVKLREKKRERSLLIIYWDCKRVQCTRFATITRVEGIVTELFKLLAVFYFQLLHVFHHYLCRKRNVCRYCTSQRSVSILCKVLTKWKRKWKLKLKKRKRYWKTLYCNIGVSGRMLFYKIDTYHFFLYQHVGVKMREIKGNSYFISRLLR